MPPPCAGWRGDIAAMRDTRIGAILWISRRGCLGAQKRVSHHSPPSAQFDEDVARLIVQGAYTFGYAAGHAAGQRHAPGDALVGQNLIHTEPVALCQMVEACMQLFAKNRRAHAAHAITELKVAQHQLRRRPGRRLSALPSHLKLVSSQLNLGRFRVGDLAVKPPKFANLHSHFFGEPARASLMRWKPLLFSTVGRRGRPFVMPATRSPICRYGPRGPILS